MVPAGEIAVDRLSSLGGDAMSSLDVVRDGYAAFGRGDIPGLLGMCDPAVEWVYHGSVPWAGSFSRHEGVARFFGILSNALDIETFEPREFIVGGDNVAVQGWTSAKVKVSGKKFDNHWAHVFTIRDGKLARYVGYDTSAIAN
jgi:uncharacterized protein